MTKSTAIYFFSGVANLAKDINVTRATIYNWPEELPQKTADLISGAALRLGIKLEFPDVEL